MKKGLVKILVLAFSLLLVWIFLLPGAGAQVREFSVFHDNPEWQNIWVKFGEASAEDIGIKAVPTDYETEIYTSRVKIDLTTPRAPGVFKWWFGYRAFELWDAGLLADLSDVYEEVGEYIAPGVKEALSMDGVPYALPFNVGYWVWYYSKAVYDEYGLELPETWEEFVEQMTFFKEEGIYSIGNTIGVSRWTSFIVFQEILYRLDADFYYRLINGEARYTDPTAVEAMEIWKDWLEKGYFAPMDATYVEDLPRMLNEGSLAFAPFGDWYGGILQDQGLVPDEDYGVFIPPAINPEGEGAIILEISPLCVGINSPDKDIAKEWLKWYASSDSAADILWGDLRFPSTLKVTQDMIEADDPVLARILELVEDYPNALIRYWEATPVEIVEHAVDEFNTMLVSPGSYMEILESIEARAKEVWPNYGVDY